MTLTVVGGRLQGVEAVYLASAAGWKTFVVDIDKRAPASGLCTSFYCGDACDEEFLAGIVRQTDYIIPAIENDMVLDSVARVAGKYGVPLLFDRDAYSLSSSKLKSDAFFEENSIPAPLPWPRCGFPIIAKPSRSSGSEGVTLLANQTEYDRFAVNAPADTVYQQYLDGPSYSVEVIGNGREYEALQVTELFMDEVYDCRRVTAPVGLSSDEKSRFKEIALKIASLLKINGIFDVECIYSGGQFYILEIDARLPSQTPTTVFHSSGVNIFSELWRICGKGERPDTRFSEDKAALYEHIYVKDCTLRFCGEHILAEPLRHVRNFFGADEALTNFTEDAASWVATMIYKGDNRDEVEHKQKEAMSRLAELINTGR